MNFTVKSRAGFLFVAAVLLGFTIVCAQAADLNSLVLDQVRAMPQGGSYAATRIATLRLESAAHIESGKFCVLPNAASPSYCSGATYLVFLKAIEALREQGKLNLDGATLISLLIRGQQDGEGIWGRWNANGPGTARLFSELGLGRNFDRFEDARPGDFMKIFWSSEVGKLEHGHSVVYLGRQTVDGVEQIRFWSSNVPAGYGEKSVPRSKVAYAIFSRLEHPEALSKIDKLPTKDPYLARLNITISSIPEARAKTGI